MLQSSGANGLLRLFADQGCETHLFLDDDSDCPEYLWLRLFDAPYALIIDHGSKTSRPGLWGPVSLCSCFKYLQRADEDVTQGLTLHGRHSIKGMQRYISNTFRSGIQLETRQCTL